MVPAAPEKGQPDVLGPVAKTCTRLWASSRISRGRVEQSATVLTVATDQEPVAGLKLRSWIWGSEGMGEATWSRLVLTTANTRPDVSACTALMFRWSSACRLPRTASPDFHVVRDAPSVCTAQYTVPSSWLLQSTPTLLFPKATTL